MSSFIWFKNKKASTKDFEIAFLLWKKTLSRVCTWKKCMRVYEGIMYQMHLILVIKWKFSKLFTATDNCCVRISFKKLNYNKHNWNIVVIQCHMSCKRCTLNRSHCLSLSCSLSLARGYVKNYLLSFSEGEKEKKWDDDDEQ